MKYVVGIIGLGFVGKAVYSAIEKSNEYISTSPDLIIDINGDSRAKGTYDSIMKADAIFICVPSPPKENGECDTSILQQVLDNLKNYTGLIISKTTAPPSFYREAQKQFNNLVYSPEFLTAKNAEEDYWQARFIVIGGKNSAFMSFAKSVIGQTQPYAYEFHLCNIEVAAMMKYTINSFLATKVVFMNEIKQLCDDNQIEYERVIDLVGSDRRMGYSHFAVPGHDGQFGFGGACFPKDTEALLKFAEKSSTKMDVLQSAVEKNKIIR